MFDWILVGVLVAEGLAFIALMVPLLFEEFFLTRDQRRGDREWRERGDDNTGGIVDRT